MTGLAVGSVPLPTGAPRFNPYTVSRFAAIFGSALFEQRGRQLEKFFLGLLKLFVQLGVMFLVAVWSGIGLVLYLAPAFYALLWMVRQGETKAAPGVFFVVLIATGLLSLYWKALSRVVDVFHLGNRVILRSQEKMLAEIDQPRALDQRE